MANTKILRVGIIGCGSITQISHLHAFNFLRDYFRVTYLCDVSPGSLELCAKQVHGGVPKTTTKAEELCSSSDVDAVLLANATPMHTAHAVLALQNNKHVLVEKPLALCYRDIDFLEAAEKKSSAKLFVGLMRRYAPEFLEAAQELKGEKVQYARIRDIIGPNDYFINQTGTFPQVFSDIPEQDKSAVAAVDADINKQALENEFQVPNTPDNRRLLAILGGLGSHDLSAMRELLGMPRKVLGCHMKLPIWTATFDYGDFPVVYESGLNDVPIFDCHVEVYTNTKIVRINYDTNFIKGLPTTMTVREKVERGNGQQAKYQEREVRVTYEDSYTVQFKDWHDCILTGRQPKTGISDAREDVDIYKMLLQAENSQK